MTQPEAHADGNAGDACAQIQRWLAGQERARPRDWTRLLTEMKGLLGQLCSIDVVMSDAKSRAIILDMVVAADMEELDFQADVLGFRIQELLAERMGGEPGRIFVPPGGPATRTPMSRTSATSFEDEEDSSSRTFLRL